MGSNKARQSPIGYVKVANEGTIFSTILPILTARAVVSAPFVIRSRRSAISSLLLLIRSRIAARAATADADLPLVAGKRSTLVRRKSPPQRGHDPLRRLFSFSSLTK